MPYSVPPPPCNFLAAACAMPSLIAPLASLASRGSRLRSRLLRRRSQTIRRVCSFLLHCSLRSLRLALCCRCLPHSLRRRRTCLLARSSRTAARQPGSVRRRAIPDARSAERVVEVRARAITSRLRASVNRAPLSGRASEPTRFSSASERGRQGTVSAIARAITSKEGRFLVEPPPAACFC